jgi:hypothetical protein
MFLGIPAGTDFQTVMRQFLIKIKTDTENIKEYLAATHVIKEHFGRQLLKVMASIPEKDGEKQPMQVLQNIN